MVVVCVWGEGEGREGGGEGDWVGLGWGRVGWGVEGGRGGRRGEREGEREGSRAVPKLPEVRGEEDRQALWITTLSQRAATLGFRP